MSETISLLTSILEKILTYLSFYPPNVLARAAFNFTTLTLASAAERRPCPNSNISRKSL
jgi:hypothetical protein